MKRYIYSLLLLATLPVQGFSQSPAPATPLSQQTIAISLANGKQIEATQFSLTDGRVSILAPELTKPVSLPLAQVKAFSVDHQQATSVTSRFEMMSAQIAALERELALMEEQVEARDITITNMLAVGTADLKKDELIKSMRAEIMQLHERLNGAVANARFYQSVRSAEVLAQEESQARRALLMQNQQMQAVITQQSAMIGVPAAGAATKRQIGDSIESRIEDEFEGWDGDTVVQLENGQIWHQVVGLIWLL